MKLIQLKNKWDKFGEKDPFWAILTHPDKVNNKWNQEEFFLTGENEIKSIMQKIKIFNAPTHHGRALDFGCGVGRLTQAMGKYFENVYGVDISPAMIRHAKIFNRIGGKCKYLLIEEDNLKKFKDNYFDFIYSDITLQHIEPKYSKNYIREFIRILKSDGLLVFQTVSHLTLPYKIVDYIENNRFTKGLYTKLVTIHRPMDTHPIQNNEIIKLIRNNHANVVFTEKDMNNSSKWIGYFYFVIKK